MRSSRFVRLVILLIAAAAAAAAFPARASAQQAADPANTELEQEIRTAPVVIDGNALFRVRGVTSFPAEERAEAIALRIAQLAASGAFDPEALRLEASESAVQILADRLVVVGVYEADATTEGVDRAALATLYRERIRQAIVAYRADRTAAALQNAVLRTLGATASLIVALVVVVWLRRVIDRRLEARYRHRIETLTAKSKDVVSAGSVLRSVRSGLRFVRTTIVVVLGFGYLEYVLTQFPQTRGVGTSLGGYLLWPLRSMGTSLTEAAPGLLFLAVLFFVVRLILTLVHRFFTSVDQGRLVFEHFDRDWAIPTYKLVRTAIIAFAVVVGFPYIPGSSSDAFKGVSLFLGVVFSLGSSSFLANMIAGYSMSYRRLFKVGDRVQVGDVTGEVTSIRLQVTHVRTIRNEEVTIPNSVILNAHVVNYTAFARTKGLMLKATVGIGYETPWRQVEAMLLEAARRTPGLLAEPAPFIQHQALADFAVTYAVCVFTSEPMKMEATYTNLHRNILDVFNEYGVQIMTPAYERDPEIPKIVPPDQWYLAPAAPAASATPEART